VLYKNYRHVNLSRFSRDMIDSRYRSFAIKRSSAAFAKSLLNIDNEYGSIHVFTLFISGHMFVPKFLTDWLPLVVAERRV